MKIAFFNYLMLEYGGGTAKFFLEISTSLKRRYPSENISVVTFDEKLVKKIIKLYSFYYGRDVEQEFRKESKSSIEKKLGKVVYKKAESISDLKRILSEQDVVYSKNDILEAAILKFLVGRRHTKHLIFGFHSPVRYERTNLIHSKLHNFLYGSVLYKFLLTGSSKFHVLNKYDEGVLKQSFPKYKIVRIYNPFDFRKFSNTTRTAKYKSNNKRINILWVGRLTIEKGLDDLVKIVNLVNAKNESRTTWTIVGEGPLKEEAVNLCRKWKNVQYLGYKNNQDMPSVYSKADLFLCTSNFETFPYTFLEAQSFGIPIISYKIHGCDEIVDHGKNGYLIDSLEMFVQRINSIVQKQSFEKKRIKLYIEKKFDKEKSYKQLFELLRIE